MGASMELGDKVTVEVGKVIGDMAVFFVRKQCRDIGIDIAQLRNQDLPVLADRLEKAVSHFTSREVAFGLKRGILEIPSLQSS